MHFDDHVIGEKAWGTAELHIVDDLGCVPNTWPDHDRHVVYLDPGDDVKQEEDLILLYGRETCEKVMGGPDIVSRWQSL